MILILIFGEVLGLYGYVAAVSGKEKLNKRTNLCARLIVGLILNSKSKA